MLKIEKNVMKQITSGLYFAERIVLLSVLTLACVWIEGCLRIYIIHFVYPDKKYNFELKFKYYNFLLK